jgi:DNA repair photolyase
MTIHVLELKTGIARTYEFERKRLAWYAVNTGTKCGNGCLYCSTGCVMRMHWSFTKVGESPFANGYAIVDPHTPDRVARDARRIRRRGMVQLCTILDAWSPEARQYDLGRRCLEAILSEPVWTVRILTKNAEVANDFDLISRYRDRVLVGLSLTATPAKSNIMSIVEPNASPNPDRMAVLREAHKLGLRTYGMLCPLLPGVVDGPDQVEELVRFAAECGTEEIFVEPVNPRGPGLRLTQEALQAHGYDVEADAVGGIRQTDYWSNYVLQLIRDVQRAVRKAYDIERLRFLLYPSRLSPNHLGQIRHDDAGVIWLR